MGINIYNNIYIYMYIEYIYIYIHSINHCSLSTGILGGRAFQCISLSKKYIVHHLQPREMVLRVVFR